MGFQMHQSLLNAACVNNHETYSNSNYINIFQFSLDDVQYGINKLKPRSSVGPDSIPPFILKHFKQLFSTPLCHIFNMSLAEGVYPYHWKISRVTPIPKTTDKSAVEGYRPIAILSSPAKIFENVLHKLIYSQVEKYLCNYQHGFRCKRSVNTNLLTITEYISKHLDNKRQVDVLYFDFCKAFDRVNNDILLLKLSAIGFCPNLLRLLADYLRDRQQFVRLGIYVSRPYHTRSGVSQGSILGPLLFLLMVNDLPSSAKFAECLLYADDLKLYSVVGTVSDCEAVQNDINAIYEWGVQNKMEFNVSKCYVMTFGRMRHPIDFEYKLNGTIITRSTNMKDLGVTFDQKLTFHDHVSAVAKESFKRLGFVLRNARDFRNEQVIRLLYSTLVRTKLEASSSVWNPHEAKYALLLEKVQKAFLRFLYGRTRGYYPYLYPTKFLLGCLGYHMLETRRACDQIGVMLKICRGITDAPDIHNELIRLHTPDNYLRGRRHQLLSLPSRRTAARAASPVPRVLTALNKLVEANLDCDLFADKFVDLMVKCLHFCESNSI